MTKVVGAYTDPVKQRTPIHPEYAASILDDLAADDAIFTADTGMCNVWTARYLNPNGSRRFISSARSEEHTSELQSLMRISYAVFCLKKKTIAKAKKE